MSVDKNWPVQDAKAHFSEFLREAEKEPQIITYRGQPKFEVRLLPEAAKKAAVSNDGLPRWWLNAPTAPDFKLPPRRREKPRKVF
jgi:antitoxin (DNA-binding transcriptional repressor) of toxin-antitoxin stability system